MRAFLLRLFPSGWRRRYEEEFLALLEECRLTPMVIWDVIIAAFIAHHELCIGEDVTIPPEDGPGDAPLAIMAATAIVVVVCMGIGIAAHAPLALDVAPLAMSVVVGGLLLVASRRHRSRST